eukprot:4501082-Pleurochrysis_carterae.AAC.3
MTAYMCGNLLFQVVSALFAKHFKLKAGGLAPAVGVKSRSLSALASAHEAAAPDPGNRRAAAETAEAAPAKTLRTESSRSASATGLMLIFFLMMAVAIIASIIACVEGKRHDSIRAEDSQMGSLAAHKYPPLTRCHLLLPHYSKATGDHSSAVMCNVPHCSRFPLPYWLRARLAEGQENALRFYHNERYICAMLLVVLSALKCSKVVSFSQAIERRTRTTGSRRYDYKP